MQTFEYFDKIATIPHCSGETAKLRDFLADFARERGCEVKVDSAGNIHALKGEPKVCLQAHYDMVCVGDAPRVEIAREGEFLHAKNSSLGADDGIGVAICMEMLTRHRNIEVLWTNDEEIGMLGAEAFRGEIVAPNLLNLDSESENEIIVGCAGGAGVRVKFEKQFKFEKGRVFEVCVSGLPGGHSGIEIHKNIPNAIKILAEFLAARRCKIISISGGERSNSIPVAARATVLCKSDLSDAAAGFDGIWARDLGVKKVKVLKGSKRILGFLAAFAQGVRKWDYALNMTEESINLSVIKETRSAIEIEFYARAMSEKGLERLKFETAALARLAGAKSSFDEQSAPWSAEVGEFARTVEKIAQEFVPGVRIATIHAGLECGVLCAKKRDLQVCSIGPNIYSPHSVNEKCEIKSVEKIAAIVEKIISETE